MAYLGVRYEQRPDCKMNEMTAICNQAASTEGRVFQELVFLLNSCNKVSKVAAHSPGTPLLPQQLQQSCRKALDACACIVRCQ